MFCILNFVKMWMITNTCLSFNFETPKILLFMFFAFTELLPSFHEWCVSAVTKDLFEMLKCTK